MRLSISTRRVEGVIIVDCYGRLVFGDESTELRSQVKALMPISSRLVLNLKDVNFLDSCGTGTLVGLFASARAAGGDIKLANLSGRIRDVLHVTKLISVFEIYDSEYDAVAAFGKA